jgi:hypothetical protein
MTPLLLAISPLRMRQRTIVIIHLGTLCVVLLLIIGAGDIVYTIFGDGHDGGVAGLTMIIGNGIGGWLPHGGLAGTYIMLWCGAGGGSDGAIIMHIMRFGNGAFYGADITCRMVGAVALRHYGLRTHVGIVMHAMILLHAGALLMMGIDGHDHRIAHDLVVLRDHIAGRMYLIHWAAHFIVFAAHFGCVIHALLSAMISARSRLHSIVRGPFVAGDKGTRGYGHHDVFHGNLNWLLMQGTITLPWPVQA